MPRRRSSRYGKAGLSGLFLLGMAVLAPAEPLVIEIESASAGVDQRTGEPVVNLKFKKEYARAFAELTERNLGKPIDVRINGKPLFSPAMVVREAIFGGSFQISGKLSADTAAEVASDLSKAGTVEVEPVDLTQYGPATGPLSPDPSRH
jgi:preprotein translocase subunit SecD